MPLQPFPTFIAPSYPAQSVFLDASRTINFYLEKLESGVGRSPYALIGTPGKVLFATLGAGPNRGQLAAPDGFLYSVGGSNLYKVTSAGGATSLGSVGNDSKPVSMAASATDILVLSAGLGYYVRAGVLSAITSGGFPANALVGGYSDGYFIVLSADGFFYISALRDVTTWSALDRGTVESQSNTAIAMLIDHREVAIFGDRITQIFDDTGAEFPFEPSPAGILQQGCAARFSPARLDNSFFWLGQNEHGSGMVWRAEGYSPRRISNHAVEYAIQNYTRIDDAVGFGYQWQGHSFYRLSFPTAQASWEYDVATNDWHECLYWNGASYEADLGLHYAFQFGKHLVGDRASANIYQLSGTTYTDNGSTIRRLRQAPHIVQAANGGLVYGMFQLDLEPGLGLVSGQGSDPTFLLSWSNDGGKKFLAEREIRCGKRGEYRTRARAHRLGSAEDRVFRAVFTDPIPWRLTGAWLLAE